MEVYIFITNLNSNGKHFGLQTWGDAQQHFAMIHKMVRVFFFLDAVSD